MDCLFIACLPLIEADIPAVLALDQRCLGGLWTASGYQRELESECSDLCVLVSAKTAMPIQQRQHIPAHTESASLAAVDPTVRLPQRFSQVDVQAAPCLHLLGIGCLWAILEEAHITTLAIEPGYQGQKLGLLLLTHLLTCGRMRGLT